MVFPCNTVSLPEDTILQETSLRGTRGRSVLARKYYLAGPDVARARKERQRAGAHTSVTNERGGRFRARPARLVCPRRDSACGR